MSDFDLEKRVEALCPHDRVILYYEMKQPEDNPGFFGKSEFFKADLKNILTLGKSCAELGAREIALSWPSSWSDATVRTDIDRLEIGVLGDGSDPSIQFISFLDGTDLRVESECIPFHQVMNSIEEALRNGRANVLIAPSDGDIQDAYDDFEALAQQTSPHFSPK